MREIKNDPKFDYYLVCNKICGNAHFNMKMKVIVEDEASYKEWINQQNGLFTTTNEVEESEEVQPEESVETERNRRN